MLRHLENSTEVEINGALDVVARELQELASVDVGHVARATCRTRSARSTPAVSASGAEPIVKRQSARGLASSSASAVAAVALVHAVLAVVLLEFELRRPQ